MAHLLPINPANFYINGLPIPASYFQAIDAAQAATVNGDSGGTWNPSRPIIIAGAGVWLSGPSTMVTGCSVTTGIAVGTSADRMVFADNDAPILGPGHAMATRTIISSPLAMLGNASAGLSQPSSPGFDVGDLVGGGQGSRYILPLEVHNFGLLQQVTLTFLAAAAHSQLPAAFPSMRVYAADAFGDVFPLGGSTTPGSTGFLSLNPSPASLGAYAGQTMAIIYPINPGLQFIDRGDFTYMIEIVDEAGPGAIAGNRFQQVQTLIGSIPSIYIP